MGTQTSDEKSEREELRFLLLKEHRNLAENERMALLIEKYSKAPKDKMVRVGQVKTK